MVGYISVIYEHEPCVKISLGTGKRTINLIVRNLVIPITKLLHFLNKKVIHLLPQRFVINISVEIYMPSTTLNISTNRQHPKVTPIPFVWFIKIVKILLLFLNRSTIS